MSITITTNISIFQNIESFRLAISQSNLLSNCGGGYPKNPWIKPVSSWDTAISIISDMSLDAIPSRIMDKTIHDGLKTARIHSNRNQTTFARFFSKFYKSDIPENCKFKEKIINIPDKNLKKYSEIPLLEDHLNSILSVTSFLIQENSLNEFKWLFLASDVIICGYLPIDIIMDSKSHNGDCLLIY